MPDTRIRRGIIEDFLRSELRNENENSQKSSVVFPYLMSELLYDFLYHPIYLMKSHDKKERESIWQDQDSIVARSIYTLKSDLKGTL